MLWTNNANHSAIILLGSSLSPLYDYQIFPLDIIEEDRCQRAESKGQRAEGMSCAALGALCSDGIGKTTTFHRAGLRLEATKG